VTGQQDEEMVLVPRKPTRKMLDATSDNAHDENAAGVWETMIACYEGRLKPFRIGSLACSQFRELIGRQLNATALAEFDEPIHNLPRSVKDFC
jgi:hypothetical protein